LHHIIVASQDTIQKEKDILEQGYPDVSAVGPSAAGAGPSSSSPDLPLSSGGPAVGTGTIGGQAVLLDDAGGNTSHLYVDVVGEFSRSLRHRSNSSSGGAGEGGGGGGGVGDPSDGGVGRSGCQSPCLPILTPCLPSPHFAADADQDAPKALHSISPAATCPPLPPAHLSYLSYPPAHLLAAEADLDAPKTFQDKVDDREKLRLIRRFFYGVCAYRECPSRQCHSWPGRASWQIGQP